MNARLLRLPPSSSEWTLSALHAAADLDLLMVIRVYTTHNSDPGNFKQTDHCDLIEVSRDAAGLLAITRIGDGDADPKIAQRIRTQLDDESCGLAGWGLAYTIGRDCDTGLAEWLGRAALIKARQQHRLIDLQLASKLCFKPLDQRRWGPPGAGEWWRRSNEAIEQQAQHWLVMAPMLEERVSAFRAKRHRAPDAGAEARRLSDRALFETIERYVARVSALANSISMQARASVGDQVSSWRGSVQAVVAPPVPASERLQTMYESILYFSRYTDETRMRLESGLPRLAAAISAVERAVSLISDKPGQRKDMLAMVDNLDKARAELEGLVVPPPAQMKALAAEFGRLAEGLRVSDQNQGQRDRLAALLVADDLHVCQLELELLDDRYEQVRARIADLGAYPLRLKDLAFHLRALLGIAPQQDAGQP